MRLRLSLSKLLKKKPLLKKAKHWNWANASFRKLLERKQILREQMELRAKPNGKIEKGTLLLVEKFYSGERFIAVANGKGQLTVNWIEERASNFKKADFPERIRIGMTVKKSGDFGGCEILNTVKVRVRSKDKQPK